MRHVKVVVIMVMIGSLFGCGGSDKPNPRLADKADATRAAARETFPLIGKAVKAVSYTSTGGGRWEICGMEPSPTGAEYVAEVAIALTNVGSSEYPNLIESVLKSAGWKVEKRTSEVVKASKDELLLRADYGDGGINLSIASGCVDSSKNSIRKLTDKSREELGLPLPS
jgi:hypothetical protein